MEASHEDPKCSLSLGSSMGPLDMEQTFVVPKYMEGE
jgi:hypothetical protein